MRHKFFTFSPRLEKQIFFYPVDDGLFKLFGFADIFHNRFQHGFQNNILAQLFHFIGEKNWGDVSKAELRRLAQELTAGEFEIHGKGQFKEEFVTAGGVSLKEVDFKTMQSRVVENLFFVGEVLDIDGITGGFNFQAAWTTGWLAGSAMA